MESYQQLFKEGKFEAILELTTNAYDPDTIYLRMECFLELGLYDEILREIKQKIRYLIPILGLVLQYHTRLIKKNLVDWRLSNELAQIYIQIPYQNQSVEEQLKAFRDALSEPPQSKSTLSRMDLIQRKLEQKNYKDVVDLIAGMSPEETALHTSFLRLLLTEQQHPLVLTQILVQMKKSSLQEPIKLVKQSLQMEVIPHDLEFPLESLIELETLKGIRRIKDPSLGKIAEQLFSTWALILYPFPLHEEAPVLAQAFEWIAHQYLRSKVLPKPLIRFAEDPQHRALIEEIREIIERDDHVL